MNVKHILGTALLTAAVTACTPTPETSAEFELTYASPYTPGHPFSLADQAWMNQIEKQSQGRIHFKAFWAGSLVTADMSMIEIKHGVADLGLITPIYAKGGTHLLRTQAGFYGGVQTIEDQVAVYNCLATEYPQFQKELDGLEVLAVQGGNFPGVLTRDKPITTLDDFKGMRLRVQTEAVEVLRRLGADPVNMPMGEVYSALAKGVIDGVVAPADTIHSLHFSEVAKHFTHIKFSRGAYPARAMSSQSWQQLPEDLQALLRDGHKVWETALSTELKKGQAKGIQFGAENGITFHDFPASEQARFNTLYNDVALAEARELAELQINAEPVFHTAQALITAGSPIQCNGNNTP